MNQSQQPQMASTFICSRRVGKFSGLWWQVFALHMSWSQNANTASCFCGYSHVQATNTHWVRNYGTAVILPTINICPTEDKLAPPILLEDRFSLHSGFSSRSQSHQLVMNEQKACMLTQ